MSILNGQDLIDAGYETGPMIGEMLAMVAELEERGITDKKYVLKLLKRDFKAPPPKAVMRENPLKLAEALQYVSRWTRANHEAIHARFLKRIGAEAVTQFGNEHDFVWQRGDLFLHGKGATPAWKDEDGRPLLGLIPLNMAAPILIVLGLDNDEFLSFAPHGAGRNKSRNAMKRQYPDAESRMRAIKEGTRGIVSW